MKKLICFFALSILLCTTASFAQKGKAVSPYWVVTIDRVYGDSVPSIGGGPYDPTKTSVSMWANTSANPPDAKCNCNVFNVAMVNRDPYAPRAYPTTTPPTPLTEWMAFWHFKLSGITAPDNREITDDVDLLAPRPQEGGYFWPYKDKYSPPTQQSQIDFLNQNLHPLQYYDYVGLRASFTGPSFLDMASGERRQISANLSLFVGPKGDCSAPDARGIGGSYGPVLEGFPGAELAFITRTGNSWKLDFKQPIYLYELGYQMQTWTVGKRNYGGCNLYLGGGEWTTPVQFSMTFTRMPN